VSLITPKRIDEEAIKKVYGDKGYHGEPNWSFLHLNEMEDGITRIDTSNAKITEIEVERNKKISKMRYVVAQYFGLSHLHDGLQLVEPPALRVPIERGLLLS
jgi:IS5 family transposase